MTLSAIGIILFLAVFGVAVLVSKNSPQVQALFIRIKNFIFWNFLIRYFQAAFIGFNFAALKVIQNHGGGFKDVGSSVFILLIQVSILCLIAYILLRKDLAELNKLQTREKIGNLYFNLDTSERRKVLFGLLFFFQRCTLIILVAFRLDFSI